MTGGITTALKRWTGGGHGHAVIDGREEIIRWRTEQQVVEGSSTYDLPAGGHTRVDTIGNPLGQVLVACLVNRPPLLTPYGETELTDTIPLTDAAGEVMPDLLVTSEYAAAPRRWITGMDVNTPAANRTAAQVQQQWTDAPASKLWIAAHPDTTCRLFPEATLDGPSPPSTP